MTIIKIAMANRAGKAMEIVTTTTDVDSGPSLIVIAWGGMLGNFCDLLIGMLVCLLLINVALRVDPIVLMASTWKT